MSATLLTGGFKSPATQSSTGFRAILDAMSRPGVICDVAGAAPPAPMSPAAGLVALVLCDAQTPVWLAPSLRAHVPDWLRFHCGCPITEVRADAMFAFGAPDDLLPLTDWAQGNPEYPDRSATLVMALPDFGGASLTLTGPGIEVEARLPVGPAAAALAAALAENHAMAPMGVDLILTSGGCLAAVPRSSRVKE